MTQELWRPTATLKNLQLRANVFKKIRNFFDKRNVLEVETPLLSQGTVTDPYLYSLETSYQHGSKQQKMYLQTSPEFAMKRLLAAGSGPIFQICKAFRNDEIGRQHNPEFTMLEWYRPGFDHHALMNEMDELLITILNTKPAERMSYVDIFMQHTDLNPHHCNTTELKMCAKKFALEQVNVEPNDKDSWLYLLMSHVVEPKIGRGQPTFIYDFPASQSALAKIRHDNPPVAERFEVYIDGIELANGFHELSDAKEQEQRFKNDLIKRQQLQLTEVNYDQYLLDALHHGFPNCAGVALGIDRLVMLAATVENISDVITFPIDRA